MRVLSESLGPTSDVGYEPELRTRRGARADSALHSRASSRRRRTGLDVPPLHEAGGHELAADDILRNDRSLYQISQALAPLEGAQNQRIVVTTCREFACM